MIPRIKKFNKDTMTNKPDAKWVWMMDYCKKRSIPPAQEWAWRMAEDAWREHNDHPQN